MSHSYEKLIIRRVVFISLDTLASGATREPNISRFNLEGKKMAGWMNDLRFYALFNSISVISGRRADDNERL